jgi:hypothetical protein
VNAPDECPAYAQNARPVGFPLSLRLSGDMLLVDTGRKTEEVRLDSVDMVRLVYEPGNVARHCYRATLRLKGGRTLSFSSLTWRSMVEARPQDAAYGAFLRALITRIGRANPQARFLAGRPWPLWAAVAAVAAATVVAIAWFTVSAVRAGAPGTAGLGILVAALGLWQLVPMVRLNRPRPFVPEAPPPELVP